MKLVKIDEMVKQMIDMVEYEKTIFNKLLFLAKKLLDDTNDEDVFKDCAIEAKSMSNNVISESERLDILSFKLAEIDIENAVMISSNIIVIGQILDCLGNQLKSVYNNILVANVTNTKKTYKDLGYQLLSISSQLMYQYTCLQQNINMLIQVNTPNKKNYKRERRKSYYEIGETF